MTARSAGAIPSIAASWSMNRSTPLCGGGSPCAPDLTAGIRQEMAIGFQCPLPIAGPAHIGGRSADRRPDL